MIQDIGLVSSRILIIQNNHSWNDSSLNLTHCMVCCLFCQHTELSVQPGPSGLLQTEGLQSACYRAGTPSHLHLCPSSLSRPKQTQRQKHCEVTVGLQTLCFKKWSRSDFHWHYYFFHYYYYFIDKFITNIARFKYFNQCAFKLMRANFHRSRFVLFVYRYTV